MNIPSIFEIKTAAEFETRALEVFRFQYENNTVYREFCNHLGKQQASVLQLVDIPFLPIGFFKSKRVFSGAQEPTTIFTSSGTTGSTPSQHYVASLDIYERSYRLAFERFYGTIESYCVLALLPSYLEREGSSLIHMVDDLIRKSGHPDSGFYLNDLSSLHTKINRLEAEGQKTLLIGVSFALLDFVEHYPMTLGHTLIMETGGMKGRRKELIREELHEKLTDGFGVGAIHSEYGMTELLSQAYSTGDGVFRTPPWMKILIRDTEDPLSFQKVGKTGGLNIVDLANVYSCSFIATQDLGKQHQDGGVEILGRFDHSDIRGCNLMVL